MSNVSESLIKVELVSKIRVISGGNMFWLIGVDASTIQKSHFKMSKYSKQKISGVDNFRCSKMSFHDTFYLSSLHKP